MILHNGKVPLRNCQNLEPLSFIKNVYKPEPYIKLKISRRRRSLMSQFRSGILPLEVEYRKIYTHLYYDKSIKKNRKRKPSERICKICDQKETEDEFISCVYVQNIP